MVVYDLHIERIPVFKPKNDSIPFVDAYGVFAFQIPLQRLKHISRRNTKFLKHRCSMQIIEFS